MRFVHLYGHQARFFDMVVNQVGSRCRRKKISTPLLSPLKQRRSASQTKFFSLVAVCRRFEQKSCYLGMGWFSCSCLIGISHFVYASALQWYLARFYEIKVNLGAEQRITG